MLNEYTLVIDILISLNISKIRESCTVLPDLSSNNKCHHISFLFENFPLTVAHLHFPLWAFTPFHDVAPCTLQVVPVS